MNPDERNNLIKLIGIKRQLGAPLTDEEQRIASTGLWLWHESAPGVLVAAPIAPLGIAEWMKLAQRANTENAAIQRNITDS